MALPAEVGIDIAPINASTASLDCEEYETSSGYK